ncbi:MAG: molybdopterin converting factor subunit 1 [Bryobacteraceae bacterium]|nr:molybdopterin converting factor subunit 1 [Bryobacteraceae bacterium]
MRVRVLFFGMLKDAAGTAEAELELAEGATAEDAFRAAAARWPELEPRRKSTVLAVNQRYALPSDTLRDGDEVAFLPPVSGGQEEWLRAEEDAAGHFFALTLGPIDAERLKRRVAQPQDGAVVVFEGIVRNHSGGRRTLFLDYECYEPMAIREIARLGREIAGRHAVSRVAIVHRLGRMEIGEASVVIVVSAPHRKAAFDAAREAIDRLKKEVPIWKKEHFEDGAVWVEGEWDPSIAGR